MQSSAMVALRTMIMITCLVAVPLAAVFGTALPKVVQSAFDRGKTSPWNRPPTVNEEPAPPVLADLNHAAPAPPSPDSTVAENHLRLPTAHITGVRPIDDGLLTPPSAVAVQTATLWNPPPRTAQAPKTRDMTAHFAPSPLPHRPLPHRSDEPNGRHEARAGALQKTVYSQPHEEDPAEDRMVAVERPADSGQVDNVLADGERRLRRLGATYYRLETWGGDGQFYRCSCNIAVGAGSRVTRHFESIEAAPSQAIEAVIKQVDAWRARRRAG